MQTGDTANDFTLQNSEGKTTSLAELTNENSVVILFFPLAFSSVCTDMVCRVRDNMKLYNALRANVAAISVDSFFTLREFKRENNLNFTLLSDFNKTVSQSFGVLNDDYFGMKGVSKRAVFVIDKNMTIQYSEILEDSGQQPDFKAIQNVLQKG